MIDNDFQTVVYTHANKGQHQVIGSATKTRYGYRGGGDRFLVHKADIAAQPHLFQVVVVESKPKPRPAAPPPKPAPLPKVAEVAPQPIVVEDTKPVKHLPDDKEKLIANTRLDVAALPGVSPAAAAGMRKAGYDTVEAILEAGVEGLSQVKFLGKVKAEAIIKHLKERNG